MIRLRTPSPAKLSVAVKPRKCKVCRAEYIKRSMTHVACSPACAAQVAEAKRLKADRIETRARREKLKTLSDHKRETQAVFNAWIRLRDAGHPCISCGKSSGCKVNAGHFFSVGARPQHRYNPHNVHLQCEKCNSYLSGNIAAYRPNLIAKIGQEAFDALESDDRPKHYTIEDLKALKAFYRAQTKALTEQGKA